jgi:hypothetical protein
MTVEILLKIETDSEESEFKTKRDLAEAVIDRFILNELGSYEARTVKRINNKIVCYGESL